MAQQDYEQKVSKKSDTYESLLFYTFIGGGILYPTYLMSSSAANSGGELNKKSDIKAAKTQLNLTLAKEAQGTTHEVVPINVKYTVADKEIDTQEFRSIPLSTIKAEQIQNLKTAENQEASPSYASGAFVAIVAVLGLTYVVSKLPQSLRENAAELLARAHVTTADCVQNLFKKNKKAVEKSTEIVLLNKDESQPTLT